MRLSDSKSSERENTRLKTLLADISLDNDILKEADEAKLLSPLKRRKMVDTVLNTLKVSERRACRVLGQARTTQRHSPHIKNDEERLAARIVELVTLYGRYGYRRITALLKQEGWKVNHKRIERIWRKEGLKVPKKQPKRGRLWLNNGSCVRLKISNTRTMWKVMTLW